MPFFILRDRSPARSCESERSTGRLPRPDGLAMTCLFSAGPSILTPARIAAGRRGHAARPTGKRQDSPGHKKRTASAALLFQIRTMSDHTGFTRLPTSSMYDSFPVGDADRSPITRVLLDFRPAQTRTVCQRRLAAK